MNPEVGTHWGTALSRFQRALTCRRSGDSKEILTECKNAIMSACFAISVGGFGDASSTFARLWGRIPSDPDKIIDGTYETLTELREMVPPEYYLPEVPDPRRFPLDMPADRADDANYAEPKE